MQAEAFKTGSAPFYVSGLSLRADSTNRTYSSANAIVTTDDAAEPGYRIRAKSLKIVTGKYVRRAAPHSTWAECPSCIIHTTAAAWSGIQIILCSLRATAASTGLI